MSAFVKGKLKAAREAIGKKDYEKARQESLDVLEFEPDNYNANVFLGLALLSLNQTEQSEQAYRKAIASAPDQPLAWQGLSRLYEQTRDWVKYAETLEQLSRLFAKMSDATKCAEVLQKLVDLRRDPDKSTRMQLADALSLMLPDSPLFPSLSTLPPPGPTNPTSTSTHPTQLAVHNTLPILEEIVALHEREEDETIEKEVSKRRTRLGAAGPEQIRKEVVIEVLGSSRLPYFYNEILNHPNTSDELRRTTESKLLRRKQQHLHALPRTSEFAAQKAKIAAEVDELISGMVLLGIKDELAWSLFIEAKDAEHIEDYDFSTLRQFMRLFPEAAMSKMVVAYFAYMSIPILDEEEDPQAINETNEEDYVDTIIDTFSSLPDSIFAHRIVVEIYHNEGDLENTIKVAESGLELVRRAEQNNGKPLSRVQKAFNVALATSLAEYYPPKHHPRALGIINDILTQDADNIPCLMARGNILQHAGKWAEAQQLYAKVARLIPDNLVDGLRAKEEHAWCQANLHKLEDAAAELQDVISILDELEGRDVDKARSWGRLGKCYWDMGDDHREEAYRHFITSLKRSSTFAPAFTSLGIYYSEFASPPDPNRASKCFQKAFELDPREAEAARRLAEGFAEEREWDLVEVVARRTIDGEGGLEGGAATARYLPINAWAWKAVGVVELTRQNYPAAIQALQIALRTDVDDQLSWLRLGEAYSKAGRFAAAIKALERARELNPDDWICSYFIGEVQRQMGEYEEAIKAFESILIKHPSELGVLVSLSQAYLDLGRMEIATAYTARAEGSFISSIRVALRLIAASPGFRRVAWKVAADATFQLSHFTLFSDPDSVRHTLAELVPLVSDHPGKSLSGIIALPPSLQDPSDLSLRALELAIAAYDYHISLDSLDDIASGSALYDLGVALFSYSHRVSTSSKQERSQEEAIRQFKEALRMEPGNDSYWHGLGSATFESQPKIAQHAFIKALEYNSKSTSTWTNLGLLYLHHGDAELANEAFYKAQTLDPDYALAWLGQGLVATINGHAPEARALFEHAVGLSAPVPDADVEFAKRLFSKLNTTNQSRSSMLDALFPAFFVLDRFCRERSQDPSALHLFGLICERIGHVELSIEMIGRAIALLEGAYEDTEDPIIEKQFTVAHTNMARVRLSLQDYEGALESYEVVMGLLPEEPGDRSTKILLTQAQFGSGLAHFKLGHLPEALVLFEAAMNTTADDQVMQGHVVVLLAQTLWAMGTEDGRDSAKAQLLQSIETDPENLLAINTLAGMGILTDDDSLVDAALSEILALPLDQRLARDPNGEVLYLLIQHHLGQGDARQALAVAEKAVVAEPSHPEIRQELSSLILQQGDSESALAVLAGSSATQQDRFGHFRESLHLQAIARCLGGSTDPETREEAHKLAQKAVMLSPWELRNWQALAFVRSQSAS